MFLKFLQAINSNRFLLIVICIFLIPFFILSAWNHPAPEDFRTRVLSKTLSFSEMQSFFYLNWSGRWAYAALHSLAAKSTFMYHYYWLFASLFFSCTFLAFVFTLRQLNRYVLGKKLSRLTLTSIAALLLILQLHVIPEIKPQFYWFTSALTYQVPLIFFILLLGLVIRTFYIEQGRFFHLAIAFILTVVVYGFNEMFSIFLLVVATFIFAFHVSIQKVRSRIAFFLYGCNLIGALLMFLSPGIWERKTYFSHRSVWASAGIGLAKFCLVNWFFLKDPLWWLFCALVATWSMQNQAYYQNAILKRFQQLSIGKMVVLYLSIGLLVYIPTLIGSNGSLPYRAENAICFLLGLVVLLLIHLKISALPQAPPSSLNQSLIYRYRYLLVCLMIFATSQSEKLVQSLASGYFYHQVMKERENKLFDAAHENQRVVHIDEYQLALKSKMAEVFPGRIPVTLKEMIVQRPSLLYVDDYFYYGSILKYLSGVDTIYIK